MQKAYLLSKIFALVAVLLIIIVSCGPIAMKEVNFTVTNENARNVIGYRILETTSTITHELDIGINAGGSNEFTIYVMRDLRNNDPRVELDISFIFSDGSTTDRIIAKVEGIVFLVIDSSARVNIVR